MFDDIFSRFNQSIYFQSGINRSNKKITARSTRMLVQKKVAEIRFSNYVETSEDLLLRLVRQQIPDVSCSHWKGSAANGRQSVGRHD